MSVGLKITENEARYLKLIYREQRERPGKIRTVPLARSLAVKPATVTEVLQNLSNKNLVRCRRYHGVKLTRAGAAEARKLLRGHRILEVFLADILNCDAQMACREASKLDYRASRGLINAICRTYGHPKTCPCGKVIFSDPKCKKKRGE
jgi:DtxR family Mn-dependent transcriptional regulator